jgi:hypothetical protein
MGEAAANIAFATAPAFSGEHQTLIAPPTYEEHAAAFRNY